MEWRVRGLCAQYGVASFLFHSVLRPVEEFRLGLLHSRWQYRLVCCVCLGRTKEGSCRAAPPPPQMEI
jgi:hypothetical protein